MLTLLLASRERMDRPGRLAAVVVLLVTGMAWYNGRLWVHEQQFDYLVPRPRCVLPAASNGFEISVIAKRLAVLAHRVARI